MKIHKASEYRGFATTISRAASLTGIFVLGFAWSVAANGAANSVTDCDNEFATLENFGTPAVELLINLVDLPDDDTDLGRPKPTEASEPTDRSTIPYLYLTPRVESILSDVFDNDAGNSKLIILDSQEHGDVDTAGNYSFPPIVEGNGDHSILPDLEEADLPNDSARMMPRFQRHMYRTDI